MQQQSWTNADAAIITDYRIVYFHMYVDYEIWYILVVWLFTLYSSLTWVSSMSEAGGFLI